MDSIVLTGYTELLKSGRINRDQIFNHVIQGRITVDDYKTITGEECPELPLETLIAIKLDEIDKACNTDILTNGFYSNAGGVVPDNTLWGMETTDQDNWNQTASDISLGEAEEPIICKPKGLATPVGLTITQFKALWNDGKATKRSKIERAWQLKAQGRAVNSKEELNSIVY